MAYKIIWEDKIVTFEFSADMSDQDMYNSNKEVLDSDRFSTITGQFINQLNVKTHSVTGDCMKTIAKWDCEAALSNPLVKIAVLINQPVQFGLTRMYETFSNHSTWKTKIFDNVDAAMTWLKSK